MSAARSPVVPTDEREEPTPRTTAVSKGRGLSIDSWAVLLALAVAALVKLHILTTVKW